MANINPDVAPLLFVDTGLSSCCCVQVVQEYERAVIFRLGRLPAGGSKGPGEDSRYPVDI